MACWVALIWVMVIWYFVQPQYGRIIEHSDGSTDVRVKKIYCWIIFLVPFIIAGFRLDFGDTTSYISKFVNMPTGFDNFSDVIEPETKSKLYVGFEFIFKTLISENPQMWFCFVAFIQSFCVMHTLRKYSCDVGFSVFMFVGMGLSISWMGNGARQFLAVAICFACTKFLLEGKWYIYYPVLIFMMGFAPIAGRFGWTVSSWLLGGIHQATLIMLLASFCIKGKAFNYKVWIVAFVFLVLLITGGLDSFIEDSVENTTYVNDIENANADVGTNVLRVLVECIPMALAFVNKAYLDRKSTPDIVNLSANASVITSVLYIASAFTSGTYVGRLPIYTEMYNLILLPWLIRHPMRKSQTMMNLIFVGMYCVYFFYQVNICWDGLYKVGFYE